MKIVIKVGPTDRRAGRFDSSSNPATVAIAAKQLILDAVQNRANKIAKEKTVERLAAVQDHVRNDIEIYARQMLQFFFHLKSNTDGKTPLRIQMPSYESGDAFKSAFSPVGVSNPDLTMSWPALSTRTIRNKQGLTTYFVHTGELLEKMQTSFAPFLQNVLRPTISFIPTDEPGKVGKITIAMLGSKKTGINLTSFPFLKDESGLSANKLVGLGARDSDKGLLARLMEAEVADKLKNFGRPVQRPLVAPLIAYYVLQRFPDVVATSLKTRFKLGKVGDE
jgi:hypothetical protein